jgi:rubredoxin
MENSQFTYHQVKVNLPGGIIAVGDLSEMLEILEDSGVENIRFGTRQQLYFSANKKQIEDIEYGFQILDTHIEIDTQDYPNIVSSYVAEEIFNSSNWLREGVYKDILDSFNYMPKLKINLIDDSQTLIPFFSGNLNFISSDIGNYWHLYVRFPKTNQIYYWSSLVYSEDIVLLSELIEEFVLNDTRFSLDQTKMNGQNLEKLVNKNNKFIYQAPTSLLKLPEFQVPYYEGFNSYNEKYWLGIYRRNELFSVNFLKDICDICIRCRIGQLYTTPWKSIIIKGVLPADRKLWNVALNKNSINVRHASNELNWQTEDLCEEGLNLKHELCRALNEADIRTFKLCFAIKTKQKSGLFGSIIIRKQRMTDDINSDVKFDLLHTSDFNPNSNHYSTYATDITKINLLSQLIDLCQHYYELQLLAAEELSESFYNMSNSAEPRIDYVQQCPLCLSIYDETWGDGDFGIPPNTPFEKLPDNYCCPICETRHVDFVSIVRQSLNTF